MTITPNFSLRNATAGDDAAIKRLVRSSRINPLGLAWERFVVAESGGEIIGTGQVKPHGASVRELASIAVAPAHRQRGVARAIIEELIERETQRGTPRLFLYCRAGLAPFYEKFGFARIAIEAAPPPIARQLRLARMFEALTVVKVIAMCREL